MKIMVTCLSLLLTGACWAQQTYTYVDLIKQLTDLERLAAPPPVGETSQQWSSYDRASRFDEATGKYVAWDANGDGGGFIRMEEGWQVAAEMNGPGCIWRIWSAAPGKGRIRIYLDGASTPAVEMPFAELFNRNHAPFNYRSLVYEAALGKNCYVPIPYQKSCRILLERDWGLYYHFNYVTYAPGTVVPTFNRSLSHEETMALARADAFLLGRLGEDPAGFRPGEVTERRMVTVRPGSKAAVANINGARAITAIRIVFPSEVWKEDAKTLREFALSMTWDGTDAPAVWSPLGDFFGTAPGLNLYKSLPVGVAKDGMYSFWYMPFARSAVVELSNQGSETRSVRVEVTHAPLTKPADQLLRFHAKWHRDEFLPSEPERKIDWTLLATNGVGRFVGVMLHVWNPRGGWWGEGDEKFYVDGERFPSTIGTGSEDYFGYAWCNPGLFQQAYHNQTFNSGDNKGNISVNRWHLGDSIPFQRQFFGTIEKYYPDNKPTRYAAVAYWYLNAGGGDPYRPRPVSERTGYFEQPVDSYKVKGAIEGESLKVIGHTGGSLQKQAMDIWEGKWSAGEQLWWTGAKPGDVLRLTFDVSASGEYELLAQFTKAADYGVIAFRLDDGALGEPIDFFSRSVVLSGEMALGKRTLSKGTHVLTAEIVGANPSAVKGYMLGIDYLRLAKLN